MCQDRLFSSRCCFLFHNKFMVFLLLCCVLCRFIYGFCHSMPFPSHSAASASTVLSQISFVFTWDVGLNGVVLHAVEQVLQGI